MKRSHVLWILGVILGSFLSAGVADTTEVQDEDLVVIDTDAGADDAVALLLLLRASEAEVGAGTGRKPFRVLAVTCANGNTGVHNVTRNVAATIKHVGKKIPIFMGPKHGILAIPTPFDDYFGDDGFGDFLPNDVDLSDVQSEAAAVALVRLAKAHSGQITLICIGPLTNIALAILLDDQFLSRLKNLYVLGSSVHGIGNIMPGVEFNMIQDPEAADVVFRSAEKPIHLVPWETTLDASISMDWRTNVFGKKGTPDVEFLNKAERVSITKHEVWNTADALLAATYLNESITRKKSILRMSINRADGLARGITMVDYKNLTTPHNVAILEDPDVESYKNMLFEML